MYKVKCILLSYYYRRKSRQKVTKKIKNFFAGPKIIHERNQDKILSISLAAVSVTKYWSVTATAPPVRTIAENIGTVKVNDNQGVSIL